jgi:hypothetical protein
MSARTAFGGVGKGEKSGTVTVVQLLAPLKKVPRNEIFFGRVRSLDAARSLLHGAAAIETWTGSIS